MAYRLEDDGSRAYLCEDHIPGAQDDNASTPQLRLVQPPNAKAESGR